MHDLVAKRVLVTGGVGFMQVLESQGVTICGDGSQTRSFCYAGIDVGLPNTIRCFEALIKQQGE